MDIRLINLLACAAERDHPYYAAAAYALACEPGDAGAMQEAIRIRLGAARYRPEAVVRMRTEGDIVQFSFWEEAA